MTTAPTTTPSVQVDRAAPARDPLFSALTGVVALVVLLQFVFAGVFLRHDGQRDASSSWIDAHAWGAHLGTLLAVVTAVYAAVRLRARKDLLIGSVLLAVLFLVESYIGGLIRDDGKDALTAVHLPIAFLLTALVVWLPVRARK